MDLITLSSVIEKLKETFPGLVHMRIPVCNSAASYEGLVETVPGVNLDLLKMDRYKMDMSKDPLFRGEFEVIKELIAELADGEASKRECDKVVDKNGPTETGGTGIKQLRENIAESKLSYEIMDDAAQAFL